MQMTVTAAVTGQHGTTFGGNPVCCAAALAVLDVVVGADLPGRAKTLGTRITDGVLALGHPLVDHVRGAGLLLGIVLTREVAPAVERELRNAGFLTNAVSPRVLRLAPPLILTDGQVEAFLAALPGALAAAATEEAT